MNTSLFENIREHLTPTILQHVSKFLGENPNCTLNAVEGSIPTVIAGLMHFSSSSDGPIHLMDLLEQVNDSSLSTEGYGQEHPLASNETEEGRAINQRLELVVLKK